MVARELEQSRFVSFSMIGDPVVSGLLSARVCGAVSMVNSAVVSWLIDVLIVLLIPFSSWLDVYHGFWFLHTISGVLKV